MVYAVLSAIVFAETGLVIFPFLPGDTLLFIAGAFAATGELNYWVLSACWCSRPWPATPSTT
jgi:membrane-associated protein